MPSPRKKPTPPPTTIEVTIEGDNSGNLSIGDSPNQQQSKKRKRGAPLGNKNALKHGFYSDLFNRFTVSHDLDHPYDLSSEINLLRVLIKNAVSKNMDIQSGQRAMTMLNCISNATARLAILIRITTLQGGSSSSNDSISRGLELAALDMHLITEHDLSMPLTEEERLELATHIPSPPPAPRIIRSVNQTE